jgi:hypothetical protein
LSPFPNSITGLACVKNNLRDLYWKDFVGIIFFGKIGGGILMDGKGLKDPDNWA